MSNLPITLSEILNNILIRDNTLPLDLPARQRQVLLNIALCGTEEYGFSKFSCPRCGYMEIHYGTCGDANCPSCGSRKREAWIEKQKSKAVNAPAYHIIMTVPDDLNPLFVHDMKFMDSALLAASAWALRKISADPKYFGADLPGFFSCLHTWGSNMSLHPHVHIVFYAVGLDKNGELVYPKSKVWLFPAKKLAALFRKKMMKLIRKRFSHSPDFTKQLNAASNKEWNVEIRKPLNSPDSVIKYLGRYVNRTAISNSRIKGYDGKRVLFEYKDYRQDGKKKLMELEDTEFIRRFALHIPPKKFRRVRFYGFLSAAHKDDLRHIQRHTRKQKSKNEKKAVSAEKRNPGCVKCSKEMEQTAVRLRRVYGADGKRIHTERYYQTRRRLRLLSFQD